MRWAEIGAREIIDIYNGARLGRLDRADMAIEPETGRIEELIVGTPGPLGGFGRSTEVRIPWSAVQQVGPQIVLVELTDPAGRSD